LLRNELAGLKSRPTAGNLVPAGVLRHIPAAITALAALAMVLYGPIPQLANYHDFADRRTLLGIPNAADVLSNLAFAVVGLWGLLRAWRARPVSDDGSDPFSEIHEKSVRPAGRFGYGLFVVSLLLTAVGSAFYHLAPDNARLIWDRVPIALACAGLLAAVRAESLGRDHRRTTGLLAVAAVLSVIWWRVSEQAGIEDLRPYLLLQALPLVLVPIWQWLYGASRERRLAFGVAILLYIAAKVAELNDHAVYGTLVIISGHTIKHVLAAAASALAVCSIAATPNYTD
jgi:hypothetical protein